MFAEYQNTSLEYPSTTSSPEVCFSGVIICYLGTKCVFFGFVFFRAGLLGGVEFRSSNFIFGELFSGCSGFQRRLMTNHESRSPEAVFFVLRNLLNDVWAI